MKKIKLLYIGCLVLIVFAQSAVAEVLIIANPSVKEDALSKIDIKQIFFGRNRKWSDGQKIRLAILKQGPAHESFVSDYLDRTPDRYASFWKVAIVSGTGYPPKSFNGEADLLKWVGRKQGGRGVYLLRYAP